MKDAIAKAIALGFGLAQAGKEQVEKTVEELVKKGEVSREEARHLLNDLIAKGEEASRRTDANLRDRLEELLRESPFALQKDVERLEQRVAQLESRLAANTPPEE